MQKVNEYIIRKKVKNRAWVLNTIKVQRQILLILICYLVWSCGQLTTKTAKAKIFRNLDVFDQKIKIRNRAMHQQLDSFAMRNNVFVSSCHLSSKVHFAAEKMTRYLTDFSISPILPLRKILTTSRWRIHKTNENERNGNFLLLYTSPFLSCFRFQAITDLKFQH